MDWVVLDTSLSIVKAIPSSKLYKVGISQPPADFSGVIISGALTDYFSPHYLFLQLLFYNSPCGLHDCMHDACSEHATICDRNFMYNINYRMILAVKSLHNTIVFNDKLMVLIIP